MAKKTKTGKKVKKLATEKRRVRGKGGRSKNAYLYFSTAKRKEVLRATGIEDVPDNFAEAAKALSAAWAKLSGSQRRPYESCAALDRCRRDIEHLRGSKLKDHSNLQAVHSAVEALAKAAASAGAASAAVGLVEALEALDARLTNGARAACAVRGGAASAEAKAAGNGFGAQLGGRLAALLRKWAMAPQSQARPHKKAKVETAQRSTATSEGVKDELNDGMRSKFVGFLMRTAAQKVGHASFEVCRKIEQALFDQYGKDPKEYRRRARSLIHNLGAGDGNLLRQVLEGTLPAARLVQLEAEDLAPEELKARRKQERERYFRSEVHLTAGPPKRKRDLFQPRQEPESQKESPKKPKPTPEEKEAAELVPMESESVSSPSSASSSSSMSSDDESEESVWEDDFGCLPLQDSGARGQSMQASSSSTAPAEDVAPRSKGALATLLQMGFDEKRAAGTLEATGGNVEKAIAALVRGSKSST